MSTPPKSGNQLPGVSRSDPMTDRCRKHPTEHIKFYCGSHHKLGCSVCITLYHGTCRDNVSFIREDSCDIAHSQEMKDMRTDVKKLAAGLDISKSRTELAQRETNDSYDQVVADVKQLRRDINNRLDQLEENLLNEASRKRKYHLDSLTHQQTRLDDLITEVKEISSDLDRKYELKHYNQLVVAMIYAKENISALERDGARISQTLKSQRVIFSHDDQIDVLTSSLTRLGTLSLISKPEAAPKYLHDIDIKSPTDTFDCRIDGAVVLSDGRLAVTDCINKCVKIINMAGRSISEQVTLTLAPRDITLVEDNQLAVTLYDPYNRVQFLSLSPTLSVGSTINVPGCYYGITYNNGKLVMTCVDPFPSVHICDMSGNLLQQIDSDYTGNQLFGDYPMRIKLSPDKNIMYVSDWINDKVVCLNVEGVTMATYEHDRLRRPTGLAVDDSGYVYVCASGKHCVHQLSPSGQLVNILLAEKGGILGPNVITYDAGKIYIISGCADLSNYIKVYQLK